MAFFMEHQYERAETAFRAAIRQQPSASGAKINLAMALARLGRDEEALSQWRQIAADGLDRLPAEQQAAVEAEIVRLEAVLSPQDEQ
jgi:uncharacterized protein HemY